MASLTNNVTKRVHSCYGDEELENQVPYLVVVVEMYLLATTSSGSEDHPVCKLRSSGMWNCILGQTVLHILKGCSAFMFWHYNTLNVGKNSHPRRYETSATGLWELQIPPFLSYTIHLEDFFPGVPKWGLDATPHFHLVLEVQHTSTRRPRLTVGCSASHWSFLVLQIWKGLL